jgi:hypothetical protein
MAGRPGAEPLALAIAAIARRSFRTSAASVPPPGLPLRNLDEDF